MPEAKKQRKIYCRIAYSSWRSTLYFGKLHEGLCNGGKPFTVALKAPNRGKDNLQALIDCFMPEIADAKVGEVLLAFGIPEKETPNRKALSVALAKQMKALIEDDNKGIYHYRWTWI